MTRIRTSIRQILVSLFLVYLSALLLATDSCTRAARATFPADYGSVAVTWATTPWLPAEYREPLSHWQAVGKQEAHALFQAEILGEVFRCAR